MAYRRMFRSRGMPEPSGWYRRLPRNVLPAEKGFGFPRLFHGGAPRTERIPLRAPGPTPSVLRDLQVQAWAVPHTYPWGLSQASLPPGID